MMQSNGVRMRGRSVHRMGPATADGTEGRTQLPLAPAFYVMAYGVFALALIWPMPETNQRELDR